MKEREEESDFFIKTITVEDNSDLATLSFALIMEAKIILDEV